MSLNLHLLRLFTTVVRTGSFSRAADALHISQPAISKGVRDFELQVGCRLLDRTPKGVRPTREGKALVRHAEALFAAERAAEDELLSLRNLDSGSLRIGASTTIATYMISDYLGTFHRNYPGIDLHLVIANTRDIADLMLAHDIEIALVEGPVEDDELESHAWRTDVMSLIVDPRHRFAAAERAIDSAALCDEVLIVREPGSGSREVVAQALAAEGIEPKRTLEIGSTEAIKQAVAAGLGVAIVSSATISDQVTLGRLKVVPMRDLQIERTLWQLKVPGRIEIPAATAFERMIWQDRPRCRGGLEDRGLDERSDAVEFVKDTRLEEDGAGDHDGSHQRPEQAGAGPQQIFGRARRRPCVPFGRQALAKRLISQAIHCAANPLICKVNVVVSGRRSNGSDLLFQTAEWKRISVWAGCGTAFFFTGVWPPGSAGPARAFA